MRPAAMPFAAIAPASAGMPLYRVVKRALLSAIEAGSYAPGSALPSESELAAAFGVSIGTLRKAVDELAAEHIVVRRQGRGTYVATHNAGRFLFQFFHVERSDGLRVAPQVELVRFERLRERAGTIYRFYQSDFGITVVRAVERARAGAADRASARVLGIAPGLPVMHVHRTALTFGDRPVEYRHSTIDTTHHDYVNLLTRPAQAQAQADAWPQPAGAVESAASAAHGAALP